MKHKFPTVRRGRKSQKLRRLKKLDEELENNLEKIDTTMMTTKHRAHVKVYVPREVRHGIITPDLYEVAREFAPEALEQQLKQSRSRPQDEDPLAYKTGKRFGFLRLTTIHKYIQYRQRQASRRS